MCNCAIMNRLHPKMAFKQLSTVVTWMRERVKNTPILKAPVGPLASRSIPLSSPLHFTLSYVPHPPFPYSFVWKTVSVKISKSAHVIKSENKAEAVKTSLINWLGDCQRSACALLSFKRSYVTQTAVWLDVLLTEKFDLSKRGTCGQHIVHFIRMRWTVRKKATMSMKLHYKS